MRKENLVKCSLCGDIWHTFSQVGEGEVCTECGDVFEIHPQDIATEAEYREHFSLDPEDIAFSEAEEDAL